MVVDDISATSPAALAAGLLQIPVDVLCHALVVKYISTPMGEKLPVKLRPDQVGD